MMPGRPQPVSRIEGNSANVASRALFLDRDGVINVNHGYVHTPDATDWVDGIFELCRFAVQQGFALVVATNQAGIGRGMYGEDQFASYTRWMMEQFAAENVAISAVYYCPHHPSAGLGDYKQVCNCRKPAPGMLLAAQADYGFDLSRSMFIGDSCSDMIAGAAAGIGRLVLLGDTTDCSIGSNEQPLRITRLGEAHALIEALGRA